MKTEISFSRNLEVAMNYQTIKKLLLSLVLCGLGFVAVGLRSPANPSLGETQTEKPTQLGYGRAPHPPLGETQTKKPTQLGYGRAPHPLLGETQTKKPTQLD